MEDDASLIPCTLPFFSGPTAVVIPVLGDSANENSWALKLFGRLQFSSLTREALTLVGFMFLRIRAFCVAIFVCVVAMVYCE